MKDITVMSSVELTRKLIDMESISGNEKAVAGFLGDQLRRLGAHVELEEAEPNRPNVFASWGRPEVVLSTHMDTVPPFILSREDDQFVYGRGACDAKGIIAAQVEAAARLRIEGISDFGLLYLVGEERNSAGAVAANRKPRGSRFLINGEPTDNRLALGTKGALRVELETTGRAAHSAYPELGESATEKLLEILNRLRSIPLPEDPALGKTTCNIGILQAGIAPNVIPDHARAELMYRLVQPGEQLFTAIVERVGKLGTVKKILEIPPVRLNRMEGLETTIVAFATDIPSLGAWGQPYLIGPGSIHVAHTEQERIAKSELVQATEIYVKMVKKLKQ
jgi:acetylornithine deacetylase